MWERAFRRIDLPLAYTEGFSPRPKVSFGLALSTGHESLAEYLDLELDPSRVDGLEIEALPARLSAALPAGVEVAAAAVLAERTDSLQHEVTSCRYEIVAAGANITELREFAAQALAAESLVVTRERKGQSVIDDIRPAILSLHVLAEATAADGTPAVSLEAELATQPRGLRPSELLAALSPSLEEVHVRRTHQWILRADGARDEPLALARDDENAPPAPQLERV
jgi:radical SAM-linked protein